jgi:hypothetical protein
MRNSHFFYGDRYGKLSRGDYGFGSSYGGWIVTMTDEGC